MDDLDARLSAVGDGFLWAVHVIGPDDLHPAVSYIEAVTAAREHNAFFVPLMEETGVAAIAVPTVWTGSAEDHARQLSAPTPIGRRAS